MHGCRSMTFVIALVAVFASGCGSSPPPRRRTGDEIRQEILNLNRLYLTDKTQKRVLAPAQRGGAFRDDESGEICWPAVACLNPACPGKNADGTPFIFSQFDPGFYAKADGSVGYDINKAKKGGNGAGTGMCPQCYNTFNVKSLTGAARQKYVDYVQPYELPEIAKRKVELQNELAEWQTYVRERAKQKNLVKAD